MASAASRYRNAFFHALEDVTHSPRRERRHSYSEMRQTPSRSRGNALKHFHALYETQNASYEARHDACASRHESGQSANDSHESGNVWHEPRDDSCVPGLIQTNCD